MKFSKLAEIDHARDVVSTFGGYNHNTTISEGEFYDMKNMSSTNYPVLSNRCKRGTYSTHTSTNGIIAKDGICYVNGSELYITINGVDMWINWPGGLTSGKKQLISMGAYLIIMPDKKYINTKDTTDRGSIEASFQTTNFPAKYQMCNLYGDTYGNATKQDTEPSKPANKALWIDTSSVPHTLKQYSKASEMWVTIATSYVKISMVNIAREFKAMDAVKISGIKSAVSELADLEDQTSIIWDLHRDEDGNGAGDYIIVTGMLSQAKTVNSSLRLTRTMPNMDFIIESNNRLWGCRYGADVNGKIVNEIYASKLGDFKNWNYFAGTSADSYAVSCGTDGAFTGAITHLGYPIFFKENCLHKVYGNYPSNYQVQTTACRGVAKGAANSLVSANEYLIYKSPVSICLFDGSLPTEISSPLGEISYSGYDTSNTDKLRNGAVAGFNKNKYYICMLAENADDWEMFVYDLAKGMWHKEDNTRADAFCSYNGELYYIDHDSGLIKTILGSGAYTGTVGYEEPTTEWMVETGIIGTYIRTGKYSTSSLIGKKYISQLMIRMSMEAEATAAFYIQYDSIGEWEHLTTLTSTSLKSFNVPIRPKRCDHFKIRIEGAGEVKIYSVSKTIERGSDF